MKRPNNCKRIHFSCDGSIDLINIVPHAMVRAGDTASGTDVEDRTLFLWECVAVTDRGGAAWHCVEAWTEDAAKARVLAADIVAVVSSQGTLYSGPGVQPS